MWSITIAVSSVLRDSIAMRELLSETGDNRLVTMAECEVATVQATSMNGAEMSQAPPDRQPLIERSRAVSGAASSPHQPAWLSIEWLSIQDTFSKTWLKAERLSIQGVSRRRGSASKTSQARRPRHTSLTWLKHLAQYRMAARAGEKPARAADRSRPRILAPSLPSCTRRRAASTTHASLGGVVKAAMTHRLRGWDLGFGAWGLRVRG